MNALSAAAHAAVHARGTNAGHGNSTYQSADEYGEHSCCRNYQNADSKEVEGTPRAVDGLIGLVRIVVGHVDAVRELSGNLHAEEERDRDHDKGDRAEHENHEDAKLLGTRHGPLFDVHAFLRGESEPPRDHAHDHDEHGELCLYVAGKLLDASKHTGRHSNVTML